MYEELHAYVRWRLRNFYNIGAGGNGADLFANDDDPIPAHLMGRFSYFTMGHLEKLVIKDT